MLNISLSSEKIKSTKAFSLIELAIVIVIIGLIIAGITTGITLVKQSKVRNLLSLYDQARTATNTFKIKFNAMPGDFRDAGSLFSTCVTDPNLGTNTCSGNGDGLILENNPAGTRENWRVLQHLSLAGLMPINLPYLGVMVSGGSIWAGVSGQNLIKTTWDGVSSTISSRDTTNRTASMQFGSDSGGDILPYNSIFTHAEVYQFDIKIDDGIPNTGMVRAWTKNSPSCQLPASYALTNTAKDCSFYIIF